MRKLLIIFTMLASFAGFVRGQEAGLPPCSGAQLSAIDSFPPDHYALMGVVMTKDVVATLSPETFADLGEAVTKENSQELLVEYGEALVAWRASFWAEFPICAEAIEIGLALDEAAADLGALVAFQLAGVAADANPYIDSVQEGLGLFYLLMSEVPEDAASEGEDAAGTELPACTDAALSILSNILAEYRALLEVPPRTETTTGLAKYGVAQVAWRSSLWTRLPQCDLSLQVGLLISHISSQLAVELALEIGGMTDAAATFSRQIAAEQERLEQLSAPVAAFAQADDSSAPLPECSEEEALAFGARNLALNDLVGLLEEAETIPDLLVAAEAHVAWRQTLETNMPGCFGSVITAGLAYRVSSNHITAMALDFAGVMPEPNPELPVKTYLLGILTLSVIADEFSEDVEASGRTPEDLIKAAPGSGLPECEDGDIGLSFYNLFLEYADLLEVAENIETVGDLMAFREAQVDWGEEHIKFLPSCKEAAEAVFMMFTILADFSAAYAFLIAGADVEDIPYAETIWIYRDRLDDWLQRELQ